MFNTSAFPAPSFRRRVPLVLFGLVCLASSAHAHGISEASRETMTGGGILDYVWLGAEHMVTGYDHLLFLFGVVFFLTGFRDVVKFITAFTLGHCITLLGATLLGVTANAYLVDAVIALSVIYKGFENLDGFKRVFDRQAPNLLFMVFAFGLIHGFGLSTRLQELGLGHDGLVLRILAFNVGVELGQVAALTVMVGFFAAWRSSKSFERFGTAANIGLVLAGLGLFALQMVGYAHEHHEASHHGADPGHQGGAQKAPAGEHHEHGGAQKAPAGDHHEHGGDQKAPAGDHHEHGGDHHEHGGDQEAPAGDHHEHGGDQKAPAGDHHEHGGDHHEHGDPHTH